MESKEIPEERTGSIEGLIPEKEVMEILGVSKEGLDRLRYEKNFPFIQVNRVSRLYLESSLIKWVREREIILNRTV